MLFNFNEKAGDFYRKLLRRRTNEEREEGAAVPGKIY
jgi:hypothetical protein